MKDKKSFDIDALMKNITFTTDINELAGMDYVIENANENIDVKKSIYLEINKICNADCIFMVDTSCIPITKIASFTNRADKVIGTHFMNPVPLKKTIEVIRGYFTSENGPTDKVEHY